MACTAVVLQPVPATGHLRCSTKTPRSRVSRYCSTRTSRPRATSTSRLGAATVSIDGNILAYSVDTVGDERYTLRFRDLRTGEQYDDTIVGIGAGATWAADNRTLYYTTVDDAWRPDTVWRHRLGGGSPAERVYHEPDDKYWLGVGRTRSEKYLIIAAGSAVTSEVRYADAADPDAQFAVVWQRRDGVEYSVEHAVVGGEDRFLIMHNDGAENFALVEAPVADPTAFRTLVEHREDVRLDAVDAFAGHLVLSYRAEALPKIQLWPLAADGTYGRAEDITFDTELTSAGLGGNPNWDAPKLRIGATSFVIPVRIYDVDLATGSGRCCASSRCSAGTGPRTTSNGGSGRSPGRRAGADLDRSPCGPAVPGTDPAVRLRRLRVLRGPAVLDRPALAAGPRHGLRRRPRPRRRRTGPPVVRARQAAGEGQHLHRFYRGGKASHRHRHHPTAEPGGARRKRGRFADRRGCQPGARTVRGLPRAGAVRGSVDHHPRPVAAADGHRMGRVGKPPRTRTFTTT